jgi:hypothetical protein
MAENYEDVVGVLKLKQVTPVIRALFGCYNLNETYPGNGEVYIARSTKAPRVTTWGEMIPDLKLLCDSLGVAFPVFDEDEYGISEASFGMNFPQIFSNLFEYFNKAGHLKTTKLLDFIDFLKTVESYDAPEIKELYELAVLMNDGHGLESYQVDAAWHSSRLDLYDFGGWSEYQSSNYFLYSSSTTAGKDGPRISQALANERYDQAATHILQATDRMLYGITPPAARRQVGRELINQLNNTYNSNLTTGPASNETHINPYEQAAVSLTTQEQRNEVAEKIYQIADEWSQHPTQDARGKVFNAVREVVGLFEYGDANIPPMQFVPVSLSGKEYIVEDLTRHDGSGVHQIETAQWNLNIPMPMATEDHGIMKTFENLVEVYDQRRIDAAKRMFGT